MILNAIQGPYLRDLLEQPVALRNTCERLRDEPSLGRIAGDLQTGKYRRVVLTGMGSSYHALYPLHLTLTRNGFISQLVETSELIHYMRECLTAEALVVAVSQSGQSAEILRLLELADNQVSLIAITNSAESLLARRSNVCILTHAGPESSVSCKTYITSLLTLEWLGAFVTSQDTAAVKEELASAEGAVRAYLENWEAYVRHLGDTAAGVRQVFIAGRGRSLAAAGTGGLILKESARFPAEGMSSAAFRHGPLETVNGSVLVVVLGGDHHCESLNRRLARDIRAAGGRSEIIDMGSGSSAFQIPSVTERIRPILEILPIQMLSLTLAAMNGHEPGKFELASKVTTTE
jgi:glucosamine--fructose-6-phosphate aminotransferase (isomerizing)